MNQPQLIDVIIGAAAEAHPPKACRIEGTQEYSFDPIHLSDTTLHYMGASFHLHAIHLYNTSGLFKVWLSAVVDEKNSQCPCHITSRCGKPGRRCIILDGPLIGGLQISVRQLFDFLRTWYAHADGTGGYFRELHRRGPNRYALSHWFLVQIVAVDVPGSRIQLQYYGYDCVASDWLSAAELSLPPLTEADNRRLGQWFSQEKVSDWTGLHLAHVLQIEGLAVDYRDRAHRILRVAERAEMFGAVWRILKVADRYRWDDCKYSAIQVLLSDILTDRFARSGLIFIDRCDYNHRGIVHRLDQSSPRVVSRLQG